MNTLIMARNGHRSDRTPDRPGATFRCPSKRYRILSVGLVYGITGAVVGALVAVIVGHPLVCIHAGILIGAAVGASIES
jgi:hypothetical protein